MAKKVFNLGLSSGETKDLMTILNPLLFQNTLKRLRSTCPTIVSILEQLVLSPNATRNVIKTPDMKRKAAVHLLIWRRLLM
jgi:aspartate carbamoyltransferase regulatory subunit